MGVLDRYRKSGGFIQILSLIEGLSTAKQEKYLAMIEAESPVWAEAIKTKMLSVTRILAWPEQAVAEIVKTMPTKTLAVLLKGVKPDEHEKMVKFLSHSDKRRIEDEQAAFASIGEGEVNAASVKLIELVRAMVKEGQVRLDKIDPELLLDEKIEESLNSAQDYFKKSAHHDDDMGMALSSSVPSPTPSSVSRPSKVTNGPVNGSNNVHSGETASQSKDINTLQMKLMSLDKENRALRQELKHMKEKLEQIKKMAA